VGVRRDGAPVQAVDMQSDADGPPTVLTVGSVSFHVIARGDAVGIRVRDTEAAARRAFHPIDAFPVASRWRVPARFVPYTPARELTVPTVANTQEKQACPGAVEFEIDGKPQRLDVVQEPGSAELFIIFADATNRTDTYGTGRFLYAPQPQAGVVQLDFNKAFNPPCAFTPYATCPLPPPQNRLDVRIEAGEKRYHG
jgi:uncharacterized protein (DUF1684 family)